MAPSPSFVVLCLSYLFVFAARSSASPVAWPSASPHPSALPNAYAKPAESASGTFNYDVVIYGNSPGTITAAIQVKRMNRTVAIINPEGHLGGLTSSGLGWTDSKNGKGQIGGVAWEFYGAVYTHYQNDSVWTEETRSEYKSQVPNAQPGPSIDETNKVQYTFEPKAAESIFNTWVDDQGIKVYLNELLDRSAGGVTKSGTTITAIQTLSGKTFTASQFIDAGYEGDLMAAAGISYSVGRESSSMYGESLAGEVLDKDNGYANVDPYVTKGDPSSGLLQGIQDTLPSPLPQGFNGTADHTRIQSFNFRLCLTRITDNMVPITKPDGYDESEYELLLRVLEAGHEANFTASGMPNHKSDSNSQGKVSLDLVGGDFNVAAGLTYGDASFDERNTMIANHKSYQQGLMYTLAHNERVPADQRARNALWGYAKDEFTSNGNWPYSIYIREARRMVGSYVFTEADVLNNQGYVGDSIAGLGSYSLDNHVVRRVVENGTIYDEGGFYQAISTTPYPIPYKSLIPKDDEVTNLLNPVTISASHVGYSSVRMEPTFMILGQTAGTAAVMAIEQECSVQDVDRNQLTARLKSDGQKLSA